MCDKEKEQEKEQEQEQEKETPKDDADELDYYRSINGVYCLLDQRSTLALLLTTSV